MTKEPMQSDGAAKQGTPGGAAPKEHPERLIFELSEPGHIGYRLEPLDVPDVPLADLIPEAHLRKSELGFPEVTEPVVMRHFTRISVLNHHIERDVFPLGSCTMKYNPRANEVAAAMPGFAALHPLAPEEAAQGALRLMAELARHLAEITGCIAITLRAGGRRPGRVHGAPHGARLLPVARRGADARHLPRLGPRHQSGERRDGRFRAGRDPVERARARRSGGAWRASSTSAPRSSWSPTPTRSVSSRRRSRRSRRACMPLAGSSIWMGRT